MACFTPSSCVDYPIVWGKEWTREAGNVHCMKVPGPRSAGVLRAMDCKICEDDKGGIEEWKRVHKCSIRWRGFTDFELAFAYHGYNYTDTRAAISV